MFKYGLFLLTVLSENLGYAQDSACSITFPKKDDVNEPVLLTHDEDGYQLAIPDDGKLTLKQNEQLVLFCPNARNSVAQVNQNPATASCIKNELLSVAHQQYDFDDFTCLKPVRGDIKSTSTKCGSNEGRILDIGFEVTRSDWVPLIQVCYDSQHGNTLYTEHTVYGQSILHASRQGKRPSFLGNEVHQGLSPNSVYTQASQIVVFTALLRTQKQADRYIHHNSYLARGHLSPDADFLFAPLQYASYFYVNTCPQWSNINSGNWKTLEGMIRKSAGKHKEPFRIITGTHDILQLPDADGHLTNMAMDARGLLPVPKFVWKIMYSDSTKQGIAFISINNPYVESITDDLVLCQDICSKYNWIADKWRMVDRGYIYCCDIRELQHVIPTMPKLNVGGVLRA